MQRWSLTPLVADVQREIEQRLQIAEGEGQSFFFLFSNLPDGAGLQQWNNLLVRLTSSETA